MIVGELDVDDIVSWLRGRVAHLARAVWLFTALNVGLAWTLNRKTQATVA